MEEKQENYIDSLSVNLDDNTKKLADNIIKCEKVDEIKDLTHLFNIAQAKKNTLRIIKLNQLLDTVSDRIIERFEKRPDEFSNKDLLDYMQVTQSAIERAEKSLSYVDDAPAISIVQNKNDITVNIVDEFDRESKEKIMNAVQALMKKSEELETSIEINNSDVVEIKPDEENN